MKNTLSLKQINALKKFQKNEITEYYIYSKLAKVIKDKNNAEVLQRIGNEEKKHYEILKTYSAEEVNPSKTKIFWYFILARIFGITFAIKLMENGEENAQKAYSEYIRYIPEIKKIMEEENEHEKQLIELLNEESLKYAGSIVLGLNDALVELTGALAGLSLALQNTRLIAMAGLITGIAASFSMAASEYLSQKAEDTGQSPVKSATYTGIAYIFTVALLILPYLLLSHYLVCLAVTLAIAILIIFTFNYYISVAKDLNFKQRFFEMAILSLSVAALSFGIGFIVKRALGVDV